MATPITSFSNPLVKRIKRLRQKKYRRQEGAFFIEGIRVTLAALESDAPIDTIVFCSELLTSDIAWDALTKRQESGAECAEVSASVFQAISERDNPAGLGAIVGAAWVELDDLSVQPDDVLVALVGVSDPGNLGTIIRTVDAAAAAGLVLVGQTVDPFHPTAVKASMGALFSIPVSRTAGLDQLLPWAKGRGLVIVATSARSGESFWQAKFQFPVLLLLGSEGEGLPENVMMAADRAVSIPMYGSASSLNLAVAAGLLLYELRRTADIHRK